MNGDSKVRKLIGDLLDAARTLALVEFADESNDIGIVLSRIRGREHSIMDLYEAERIYDRAIRAAYRELTGKSMPKGVDPVEWVHTRAARRGYRSSAAGKERGGRK